jgi:SAM-dependent methyltransferase
MQAFAQLLVGKMKVTNFVSIPRVMLPKIPQEYLGGLVDRLRPFAPEPTSEKVKTQFAHMLQAKSGIHNSYVGSSSPWYEPLISVACNQIRSLIPVDRLNVLDLGCGSADMLTVLPRNGLDVARYTGIDLVPGISLQSSSGTSAQIIEGDATQLALNNAFGPIDLISAVNLLPYLPELTKVLHRASLQNLTTRACLLIVEPAPSLFWHRTFSEFQSILRTPEEIEAALCRYGWSVHFRTNLCVISTSTFGFGKLAYSLVATNDAFK